MAAEDRGTCESMKTVSPAQESLRAAERDDAVPTGYRMEWGMDLPKHARHAAPKHVRYAPKHARHTAPKYAQQAAVALTATLAAIALGTTGTGAAVASHLADGGATGVRSASAPHLVADGAYSIASDSAYSIASDGANSIASDSPISIGTIIPDSIASD